MQYMENTHYAKPLTYNLYNVLIKSDSLIQKGGVMPWYLFVIWVFAAVLVLGVSLVLLANALTDMGKPVPVYTGVLLFLIGGWATQYFSQFSNSHPAQLFTFAFPVWLLAGLAIIIRGVVKRKSFL